MYDDFDASRTWTCNVCGAQNSCLDGECQFCECQGKDCKRDSCSGDKHFEQMEEDDGMSDVEADADTLRSAGMGTDEDYGYFGGDE